MEKHLSLAVKSFNWAAWCLPLLLTVGGCGNKSSRVSIPSWNPTAFADAALETLDKNGDGQIDQRELADAPGLAFGARFIDENGDRKLSREELVARFTLYRDRRLGLTSREFQVSYNGRPLVGAEIRLVPEFFLTEIIEPATGTTAVQGVVRPSITGQPMPLLRAGYYRVEITSPTSKLPAKFNSATTVGVEVSSIVDDPAISETIEIQLRDTK